MHRTIVSIQLCSIQQATSRRSPASTSTKHNAITPAGCVLRDGPSPLSQHPKIRLSHVSGVYTRHKGTSTKGTSTVSSEATHCMRCPARAREQPCCARVHWGTCETCAERPALWVGGPPPAAAGTKGSYANDERMLSRRPNCSFLAALTEPSSIIFCSRSVSLVTKSLDAMILPITLT